MLKTTRLLASTAALALAVGQASPSYALLPSPQLQPPSDAENSNRAATMQNLQNRLSRVANAAAVASWTNYTFPVRRDDVDATYADSGASCDYPDGGAQIPAYVAGATVSGHCWKLVQNDKPLSVKIWNLVDDASGATGVGTDNNNIALNGTIYDAANAAVSFAAAKGRSLYWPGNKYRLTKTLQSTVGLYMFGDGCANYNGSASGVGTTLYFDHTGKGIYFPAGAVGVAKLRDFCTFRNQPTPSSTAGTAYTPNANDYDIYDIVLDLEIDNVLTINPTKQLYITGSRLISRGLRGEPQQIGVFIDDSQDTDIIDQYRAWPYWSVQFSANAQANVAAYEKANLDMIHLGRADNPFLSHIFGINTKNCITFNKSTSTPADGGPNKVHISDLDCDYSSGYSIAFYGTSGSSAIIENVTGQAGLGILSFDANTYQNTVQLQGMRATLIQSSAILMPPSLDNRVFASGIMIDGWAQDTTNHPNDPAISVGVNNEFLNQDANPTIYQRSPGTATVWLAGTKYTVANQDWRSIWGGNFDGSGEYTISAGPNGPVAEVLVAGGTTTILGQTNTTFASVSPTNGSNTNNDAGALANTAAGKIGLYFLPGGPGYKFVNNTGAAATITWREKRMGPSQ